jgi:multidrug efflux pump subunit AcrA (membrane-fusion protein)
MKKASVYIGIVVALIALGVFNKMVSKNKATNTYAEAKKGLFEITVSTSGELLAEKSLEIYGPQIGRGSDRGRNQGGGPGRGGPQQRGGDMRAMELKIQDIVPEGTIVDEGDYIAQIDRSSYENTLKDALDNLTTYRTNLEMKVLDTAVVLTGLRDDIKNQRYAVEEAAIVLEQSKFEPPATIRKADMNLNKAQRSLEQLIKSYELRVAKTLSEIEHEKFHLSQGTALVEDLQSFLADFTIKAPAPGMVTYKKERNGTKRKSGSQLNPFDAVVATLPDLSSMLSKIYVNEIDISKVKTGQAVNIKVDAFPDKSFNGEVITIANVGEQLPNSDAKLFEVLIKIDGSDPALRPSMTTGNKIVIKTFDDVVYIPTECVHTGSDSIPFVYKKNKTKQIVILGEANEKNVIVEQGLEPGVPIYLFTPEEPAKFKLAGENLIAIIKEEK